MEDMKNSRYEWVEAVHPENLPVLLEVMSDIERERQLVPNHIVVKKFPTKVRFPEIAVAGNNARWKEYGEQRIRALVFLKSKGILKDFVQIKTDDNLYKVEVSSDRDAVLIYAALWREYKSRRPTSKQEGVTRVQQVLGTVRKLVGRFHLSALELRNRHDNRPTIDITDEYDVQDLMRVLLAMEFDDVRREVWTPNYAGKSSRVDFWIKDSGIVIEIKKSSPRLRDKEVADQLIVDIERYSQMQGCNRLVCLLYDPEHYITNPVGLVNDLSREGPEFAVEVIVVPNVH
jgi:hypothetical protein